VPVEGAAVVKAGRAMAQKIVICNGAVAVAVQGIVACNGEAKAAAVGRQS